MNFFKRFNKVDYEGKQAINITNSILLRFNNINNTTLYYVYRVTDGETAEIISDNVYGNTKFHWVILLLNRVINPYYDWPLSSQELSSYISNKYNPVNDIHHFVYENREIYPNESIKINNIALILDGDILRNLSIKFRPALNNPIMNSFFNSKVILVHDLKIHIIRFRVQFCRVPFIPICLVCFSFL